MKKSLILPLFLVLPVLAGCTTHVSSITLNETEVSMYSGRTFQLEAEVKPDDADDKSIIWYTSDPEIATVDDNGLVSATNKGGEVTITAVTSDKNLKATCDFTIEKYWTIDEENLMKGNLYDYVLPYRDGNTAKYETTDQTVVVLGNVVDPTSLGEYLNKIVADGFTNVGEVYPYAYTLLKEVTFENKTRTIEIDLFAQTNDGYIDITGNGLLTAICYDPYFYDWPTSEVSNLIASFDQTTTYSVPSFNAARYGMDASTLVDKKLTIYCETSTGGDISYKDALSKNGYKIQDTVDSQGYWVADSLDFVIRVRFKQEDTTLIIVISQGPRWDSKLINAWVKELTKNSGTTLPAYIGAESYKVYENSYEQHGYVFVECVTPEDHTDIYKSQLQSAGYTVYPTKNTAANWYAVSEKQDLLVEFVYDEPWKAFEVMFQGINAWDSNDVASKLALVSSTIKASIPQYPGIGYKSELSSTNKFLTISIASATYDSLTAYGETLAKAGWFVSADSMYYFTYYGISPERDLMITFRTVDAKVNLTIEKYEDVYKGWPTEDVAELVGKLSATGTVLPFDGALGFDFSGTSYNIMYCYVTAGQESALISSYIEDLIAAGYGPKTVGDYTYYVKTGETIGVYPHSESQGVVILDLIKISEESGDLNSSFTEWLIGLGCDQSYTLPDLDFSVSVTDTMIDIGEYGGLPYFDIQIFAAQTDFNTIINEYTTALKNAGWVDEGYCLAKGNNLTAMIYENGTHVLVDIMYSA